MKKTYVFSYDYFDDLMDKLILFETRSILNNRFPFESKVLIGENRYILEINML